MTENKQLNDALFFDRKESTLANVLRTDNCQSNWNAAFMQNVVLVDVGRTIKILLISSIIE